MSLTNPNTPISEQDLQDFYYKIKPYLGTDAMPSEDMSEIVSPLPGVMSRRMKYSTSEQIIGEWIDGKPIYQKTVVFSSQSITNKTYDVATSVDKMIDGHVLLYRTDGGIKQPIIVPYMGSSTSTYDDYVVSGYWKDLNAESNSLKFAFQVGTVPAERTYDVYITVKYTKTTDTAS